VHQLRVAARRTLALLRGAEAWAAPEWGAALKEHVRWLLGELGPARDTDVFLAWLHEQATALGGDGRALARIEKRLAAVGEEAHATAQAALDDPRYAELLQLLHAPRLETGEPRFTPLARSETARLRRAARHATDPDDETLHRVRLRGKRARYALELAEPELGKRGAAAIRAAKGLQDVLGEHQDAAEAERRLRALAATARGTTALALGRLVELQQGRRRRARKAFPDAWKSFDAATRRALA
jgi:CHAD domain-containing protein